MALASKFSGESPWDAVINSFSLNIVEEDEFEAYVKKQYSDPKAVPLEILEMLYAEWEASDA